MTARARKRSRTRDELRKEAEARLAAHVPAMPVPVDADALLHELHVHQIELEMQNEQLRLAQGVLEEARDRYFDLYEFAPIGYVILTASGQVSNVNHAGAKLLGVERTDMLLRGFDRFVAPEDAERWRQLFGDLEKTDDLVVREVKLRRQDGSLFPAQIGCRRKGETGATPPLIRLVLIDLSAVMTATEKRRIAAIAFDGHDGMLVADDAGIRQLAFYDPLTNLPNRRLMVDRLHHAMAVISRTRKYCAVFFIDLDNFKTINDTLGHDVGDQLLQQVAQRLTACVREGDTVARHGGDEFVVILENLSEHAEDSANQARSIGEKIAAALNQPFHLAGQEYASSASIGAALFNDPHEPPESLLKRADIAMYEAKAAGRNALCFFDPAMQAVVNARTTLEAELRSALEADQLQCHFQLQMDDSGRIPGAEVLLRWQHPRHGLILPASFIRVAEESGLLVAINRWVMESACAQLKTWGDSLPGRRLHLAVNVCARQFSQANFVENVRAALTHSGIDPGCLTLEFKEKVVLADLDASIAKMTALKGLGVRLSIDDFGIGCSSLSQLSQLPLDQLKIDPSLVRGMGLKPNDKAIVKTLIDVTRHLGMEAVAEGVETEAQHEMLKQHGCQVFQGYLFGHPVAGNEFERLLNGH